MSTLDSFRITWRKSSLSGAGQDCVEVGVWSKSTLSGGNGGSCVEVMLVGNPQSKVERMAGTERVFLVRDSKDPNGPVLTLTPSVWDAFVTNIKDGVFTDLS
ncbi:DUF397 domain-containing protein [Streptosporangium amethystogenes subsp. fukuiense]|uniref:DUF397 domain-containing protein n=1 Tax=Streptosporangium amethystogenes subsp. fukuiense TaxID=698418 RepID=A0ABW2T2Y3_9ACTN